MNTIGLNAHYDSVEPLTLHEGYRTGFGTHLSLFVTRQEECVRVRVHDTEKGPASGLLLEAKALSMEEAKRKATLFARRHLAKVGESVPSALPDWERYIDLLEAQ